MSDETKVNFKPAHNGHIMIADSASPIVAQTFDNINLVNNGIHLVIDITAKVGSPTSMTVTLSGIDETSGKLYTLLASAALTGTGTTVLKVFPGSAVASNASANDFLPHKYRVGVAVVGVDGSNYFTYSIGAQLMR